MIYQLYYWPGIQGRGEYVRLALEDAGARYIDVARLPENDGGGVAAMERLMNGASVERPPFAPPFLKAGRQLIGQTANILLYLGGRLDLAPRDAAGRLWTHQLQLTIADFLVEIHDCHHPLGVGLYYEQQKPASKSRSDEFRDNRLSKFLDYFEGVLQRNPAAGPGMVGERITYADLSMAQVIAGLRYAFPQASRKALRACPRLRELHDEVFARPRIRDYLASDRRLPFNNDDIFRHYPELDG
ncbi:glutathione S-transferase [Lacisediminimonas profundi]|uniref:glutathione S-transferase n=1 Tax=Lacisediminimonas profundi TaxID=2603856 RepID=UPI00124B2352|nr:glutathione S-transferase [Lacisediminimonas profundi]